MITESLLMYLIFQLILFAFNIIGYKRLPILLFFTVLGTLLVSYQTINAFEDYEMIGLILIMINISIPAIGLTTVSRRT